MASGEFVGNSSMPKDHDTNEEGANWELSGFRTKKPRASKSKVRVVEPSPEEAAEQEEILRRIRSKRSEFKPGDP